MRVLSAAAYILLFAAFSPASTSSSAAADDVSVKLGDGTVDARRLKPFDNAFTITLEREDGVKLPRGIFVSRLELLNVGGRQSFVRTEGRVSSDGTSAAIVNTFDPVTFAPVSNSLNWADGSKEKWTFTDRNAEGHFFTPDGKETVRKVEFAEPAYDFNCCIRSLIPAAIALHAGETLELPGIVSSEGEPSVVTLRVVGREPVQAGFKGTVNAWRVEAPVPGGGTARFWIIDTPPYLVRMTLLDVPSNKTPAGLHFNQSYDMIK